MSISALFELALTLLPKVEVGVTEFISWVQSLRAAAQQSGEWTDAQEQAYRAALLDKNIRPEEIPD